MARRRALSSFPLLAGIAVLVLFLSGLGCSICPFVPQPATSTPLPPAPTPTPPAPTSTPKPTLIPEPTPTPEVVADMALYANTLSGFSIRYPEDWVYETADNAAYFAEDEDALASFDPTISPIFVIRAGSSEEIEEEIGSGGGPEDLLDSLLNDLFVDDLEIGEVEPWTFNQASGVGVEVGWREEGGDIRGYVVVAMSEETTGVGFGFSPGDEWSSYGPVVREMFASLEFFAPKVPEPVDRGPVLPGETVHGTLALGGREVWALEAETGQYITIWMESVGSGDLDTYLELYAEDDSDEDGVLIAEDDDGGVDTDSLLSDFYVEASGTYYIHALTYSGSGDYQMRVDVADKPSGGGEITFGETVEGTVAGGGQHEWVFVGQQGDEVSITMRSVDHGLDCYLELYSADGDLLAYDDVSGGNEDAWIAYFVLPADGSYTIVASDISGEAGTYELTLEMAQLEIEGVLTFGQTIAATLEPGVRHYWSFEGATGDIVTISMLASDGDWDTYLELYTPDGEQLAFDDDSGGDSNAAILEFELPLTGTYRVVARGYNADEAGDYELTVEKVELEIQGNLVPDETVAETLEPGVRHHWLFEGDEGETVTISLIAVDEDWDTFLELYAPDGEQVTIDDDSGGGGNAAILEFELPLTGIYRVVARGFSSFDTGEYELTLTKP
jgi:hypothetical protein